MSCTPLQPIRSVVTAWRWTVALSCCALLAACGGGGSGSGGSAGSTATSTSTTGTASASASTAVNYTTTPTISGVAATGAPLNNATITVIDGHGTAVGNGTSGAVDGAFRIALTSNSLNPPLLLQLRGIDAAGNPRVLHSAVPALAASAPAMVANITTLSNAVVALAMGGDPQPVLAAPAQNATAIAAVASAASGAAAFVRTIVKAELSDLKASTTLDLLGDPAFAANKGAHDLLLESLRVALAPNSQGVLQLQLGNKLLAGSPVEVAVSLGAAQAQLLASGGTPASAITSTLTATTSPTATLATLGSLDSLSAALNQLIAQGQTAAAMSTAPLLVGYNVHQGRYAIGVAAKLAQYVAANAQFGRWTVTGCADDTVTAGVCKRVKVSAPVTAADGTVIDVYSDAVAYNKASTTGSPWNLIGDGQKIASGLYPVAYRALAADASVDAAVTPNPALGLQLLVQGQDAVYTQVPLVATATVQTPGGHSIALAYCGLPMMCLSSTPGASAVAASGSAIDNLLELASSGWLAAVDTARNAKWSLSYTLFGTAAVHPLFLGAELPSNPQAARFPALDGVAVATPLSTASLLAGMNVAWSGWAAANPDLRLLTLRSTLSDTTNAAQTPFVVDAAAPLPPTSSATLAAITLPDGYTTNHAELLLIAVDTAGRRYETRYLLGP